MAKRDYFKNRQKLEGVIRPILPTNFRIEDDMLTWDDTDAVYDEGLIEFSSDGTVWNGLYVFYPNEWQCEALTAKVHYRMRVKYNMHWSLYQNAAEVREAETPKPAEPKDKAVKTEPKKTTKKEK